MPSNEARTGVGSEDAGNRILVFWAEVLFLLMLALLAWAYFTPTAPAWLRAPAAFGVIPSGVLWFGALGGVLISLTGVHDHRYDWDPRYWTWHLLRPAFGAAVATIAVLIVMAGILAVGVQPSPATEPGSLSGGQEGPAGDTKQLFYFLVAFLVGYREEHFRELIKRLGDVLFTSAPQASGGTIAEIDPSAGPAVGGTQVRIIGSGLNGAILVQFGSARADFKQLSDAQLEATAPAGVVGTVPVTVVTTRGTVTGGTFTYE
jgi:hypothetical protein